MRSPPKTKGAPRGALRRDCEAFDLALRELEAAARTGAAVLLALDHAAVAGQEAVGLHRTPQRRLELRQRLGDAVAHRARLARQAAAGDGSDHVELAVALADVERLLDDHLLGRTREVDLLVAAVDRDLAGAELHPDAGDGVLAAAGGVRAALRVDFLLALRGGSLAAGDDRSFLQLGKRRKFGSHVSRSSNSCGSSRRHPASRAAAPRARAWGPCRCAGSSSAGGRAARG